MSVSFSVLEEFSGKHILSLSLVPLVQHPLPHLGEGEVSVGEEVAHLAVIVVHVVEEVPLDGVLIEELTEFRESFHNIRRRDLLESSPSC